MSLKLAEGLVEDVVNYLSTNMAAKVVALNAEYNDEVVLVVPTAYYTSEKSIVHIPTYPAAFVLVPDTVIPRWNIDYLEAVHTLVVGVLVLEQEESRIKIFLYRFMRAFLELLKESQTASPPLGWHLAAGSPTGAFNITFSPIFANEDSYLADAQISVSMIKQVKEVW